MGCSNSGTTAAATEPNQAGESSSLPQSASRTNPLVVRADPPRQDSHQESEPAVVVSSLPITSSSSYAAAATAGPQISLLSNRSTAGGASCISATPTPGSPPPHRAQLQKADSGSSPSYASPNVSGGVIDETSWTGPYHCHRTSPSSPLPPATQGLLQNSSSEQHQRNRRSLSSDVSQMAAGALFPLFPVDDQGGSSSYPPTVTEKSAGIPPLPRLQYDDEINAHCEECLSFLHIHPLGSSGADPSPPPPSDSTATRLGIAVLGFSLDRERQAIALQDDRAQSIDQWIAECKQYWKSDGSGPSGGRFSTSSIDLCGSSLEYPFFAPGQRQYRGAAELLPHVSLSCSGAAGAPLGYLPAPNSGGVTKIRILDALADQSASSSF